MSRSLGPSRRSVSLAAMAAAGCFAGMDRKALASAIVAARISGKPILTEASLNAAFPEPGQRIYKATMIEAAEDLQKFLTKTFELTAAQQKEIASINAEELQQVAKLLKDAEVRNERVRVGISPADHCEKDHTCKIIKVSAGLQEAQLRISGRRRKGRMTRETAGPLSPTPQKTEP